MSEPQISSPVDMAFDEEGRLFVVEMIDYPNGPANGELPSSRIRLLEDRDGDGSYERSVVFADHLNFATGVCPWKGGVYVTAAPRLWYLKDTDGDGREDVREVVFEGFSNGNPQLRANHPTLGLDGWIYIANGLQGGKVRRPGAPEAEAVDINGKDFRFDPRTGRSEAIEGPGQFVQTFDDWGNRFVGQNRHQLQHAVIPLRHLSRNPNLAVPAVLHDCPLEGNPTKVYPLTKGWTTSVQHVGTFTAACGTLLYRGGRLPGMYDGAAYTCEPTGNLVHMEVLQPDGATFGSKPVFDRREFLASTDGWFRPVNLAHGPDGALYVVDMYRAAVEHPAWMPEELRKWPALEQGKEYGRIWRIVPDEGIKAAGGGRQEADGRRQEAETGEQWDAGGGRAIRPGLSDAPTAHLVALLEHRNAWWRTTAHRLLLERADPAATKPLRETAMKGRTPQARVHAAHLLESLGALDAGTLLVLFSDESPRVRETAVRLAEPRLGAKEASKVAELLLARLIGLAKDRDGRVRFQIALVLGDVDDDRILEPLAQIALAGAEDPWTRRAVLSSVPTRAGSLAIRLSAGEASGTQAPGLPAMVRDLAAAVGARRDDGETASLIDVLAALADPECRPLQNAVLTGLAEGLARRGARLGDVLAAAAGGQGKTVFDPFWSRTAATAADPAAPAGDRMDALGLLAHADWPRAETSALPLVAGDPDPAVRSAAARAIGAHPGLPPAEALLGVWKSLTPPVRREAAEALLRTPERAGRLLDAVESGAVAPGDLDASQTGRLTAHKDVDVRERAAKVLQAGLPGDRKEALARYRAALASAKGDPRRGVAVFAKNCTTCHAFGTLGVNVGPDITDTYNKKPEQLIEDILNPNRAIDNNYVQVAVLRKDETVVTGLLAAETGGSVAIRKPGGETETILRADVAEVRPSGQSLMPEGLERTISEAEMADLISFLKNWRYVEDEIRQAAAEAAGAGRQEAGGRRQDAGANQAPETRNEKPATFLSPEGALLFQFNGKDLTGFYTWTGPEKAKAKNSDPLGVFRVLPDGTLRVSGEQYGWAVTEAEYENYRLTCEYRWGGPTHPPRVGKARDSGILFHVVGEDPHTYWPKSQEFQIIEGGTGDILCVNGASALFEPWMRPHNAAKLSPDGTRIVAGRINWWGRDPAWKDTMDVRWAKDLDKPVGEWNRLELVCDGDAFTFFVNGVKANEARGSQPAKGKILFQSEGAEVHFRNIEVRSLR